MMVWSTERDECRALSSGHPMLQMAEEKGHREHRFGNGEAQSSNSWNTLAKDGFSTGMKPRFFRTLGRGRKVRGHKFLRD